MYSGFAITTIKYYKLSLAGVRVVEERGERERAADMRFEVFLTLARVFQY
jgi:hypothetical protein